MRQPLQPYWKAIKIIQKYERFELSAITSQNKIGIIYSNRLKQLYPKINRVKITAGYTKITMGFLPDIDEEDMKRSLYL